MKIEGFVGNFDINTLNISDILGKLAVGDIIRAKVLNISANELTLKLFDGTVFNAKALSSLDAEQGDTVDFIVKNNANNQLVLETLRENENSQKSISDTDSTLKKLLIDINIKPDKNNIEIAKEIKQNNLPLNKDIFSKIADSILAFKNVTPQKAAYLVANNMPLEEKNITQLNRIVDEKQKIGLMLDNTFETLSKLTDKDVMSSVRTAIQQNYDQKAIFVETDTRTSSSLKQELIKNTVEKEFQVFNQEKEGIMPEVKEKLQEFIGKYLSSKSTDEMKINTDEKTFTDKALLFLKENMKAFEKLDIYKIKNVESFLKDIFNKINSNKSKENYDINLETSVMPPIDNAEYEKELKEAVQKLHIKMDENTTGEDLKIKKAYKEIYEKLEIIKNVVEHSAVPQKDEILNKIDNLQSNLKFINDLNNHSTYIQIPLNILGKNTTGELYVLKKGSKGKKIDPQNTSVFVSLNTPNLGQIDSLINVHKKNISLNVRVEEQAVIGFIKENYIELYNSLLGKGYKLVDVKYRLIEEDINAINAENVIMKELELKNQSIDYKI